MREGSSQVHMKPALVFVWSCDLNMSVHMRRPAPRQIKPLQLGHAYDILQKNLSFL